MKKRILITGKVHDIGYRPFLLGLAESLEIDRFFADNRFIDGEQAVEVLVDDKEDKVNSFINLVKTKTPENAVIENIKIEDYKGSVMKTESYYRYLTAMQLAKIATYGGKMLERQDSMLEKQDLMLEKQDSMLGKMDSMLEKQDETIKVIKEESEKTREEIGGKIDLLRSDLKDYIESNLKSIRQEISEIKQVLRKAGIM
ncbi:MAG: acylphosphatase [Archaeoglobus sp.]|nr:acylphosphatase [Archaeoglobus sp.]